MKKTVLVFKRLPVPEAAAAKTSCYLRDRGLRLSDVICSLRVNKHLFALHPISTSGLLFKPATTNILTDLGPFCVELACSHRAYVSSLQVPWLPPTIRKMF